MSEILSRLVPPAGSHKTSRRIGRGTGSNMGKTCGRGQKGQKARNGGNIGKLHFQGGQTPMQRRLPKRGFRVPFPAYTIALNVSMLERFAAGSTVDEAALRAARLVQGQGNPGSELRIKILGEGQLSKKLTVHAHKFSQAAVEKIKAAGGSVVTLAEEQKAEG